MVRKVSELQVSIKANIQGQCKDLGELGVIMECDLDRWLCRDGWQKGLA